MRLRKNQNIVKHSTTAQTMFIMIKMSLLINLTLVMTKI